MDKYFAVEKKEYQVGNTLTRTIINITILKYHNNVDTTLLRQYLKC